MSDNTQQATDERSESITWGIFYISTATGLIGAGIAIYDSFNPVTDTLQYIRVGMIFLAFFGFLIWYLRSINDIFNRYNRV